MKTFSRATANAYATSAYCNFVAYFPEHYTTIGNMTTHVYVNIMKEDNEPFRKFSSNVRKIARLFGGVEVSFSDDKTICKMTWYLDASEYADLV